MLKGIFSSLLVCQSSWTQLESGTCYLFRLIATKVPKLKKQKRFASNTLWIFSWQKTLWCTEKSISQLCTYTLSETASLFFSPVCVTVGADDLTEPRCFPVSFKHSPALVKQNVNLVKMCHLRA